MDGKTFIILFHISTGTMLILLCYLFIKNFVWNGCRTPAWILSCFYPFWISLWVFFLEFKSVTKNSSYETWKIGLIFLISYFFLQYWIQKEERSLLSLCFNMLVTDWSGTGTVSHSSHVYLKLIASCTCWDFKLTFNLNWSLSFAF